MTRRFGLFPDEAQPALVRNLALFFHPTCGLGVGAQGLDHLLECHDRAGPAQLNNLSECNGAAGIVGAVPTFATCRFGNRDQSGETV
jgi:hypothetical protein